MKAQRPKRKKAAPKGGPKHETVRTAYCEFVVVVLVVVVVELAAGAIELSVVVVVIELSVGVAVVVVSVVVVFSAVLVAAGLPQAATEERAATAAVATRILRRASEVMSLVPFGG